MRIDLLKISQPLSVAKVQTYWAESYTAADQSYYSQSGETQGEWFGRLAERFDLTGGVTKEKFDQLATGQHQVTGEQLVKHRNVEGISEHRAAWDFTIAPHKSASAAALVRWSVQTLGQVLAIDA